MLKKLIKKILVKIYLLSNIANIFVYILNKFHQPKKIIEYNNIGIFGWYGSETAGDKAILGSIIQNFEKITDSKVKIKVFSYFKDYTEKTLSELNISTKPEVVNLDLNTIKKHIKHLDLLIIGGGPLLDDRAMLFWLKVVILARLFKKNVAVYGCGVGPLTKEIYKNTVNNILKLSTIVGLRDKRALDLIESYDKQIKQQYKVISDPALNYLPSDKFIDKYPKLDNRLNIGISLRSWPQNYQPNSMNNAKIKKLETDYYLSIKKIISNKLKENPDIHLTLIPMHIYYNDDDREILKDLFNDEIQSGKASLIESYSLDELFSIFNSLDLCFCMRFHSAVFALKQGIPLIAVDYDANKGKVASLMESVNKQDFVTNILKFNSDWFNEKLENLIIHRKSLEKDLNEQVNLLVKKNDEFSNEVLFCFH